MSELALISSILLYLIIIESIKCALIWNSCREQRLDFSSKKLFFLKFSSNFFFFKFIPQNFQIKKMAEKLSIVKY